MALSIRWIRWLLVPLMAMPGVGVRAADCGPYRVAFYEFGSVYYRTASGNFAGIDKDVVDEVARRTGCRLEEYLDSRARTWTHLADGSLDMTVSGVQNEERERLAYFATYLKTRNYLLTVSKESQHVQSLRAFTDNPSLRLAIVKLFRHGEPFDNWIEDLKRLNRVDEYADPDTVAKVVSVGRADAFLSQPLVWTPLLEKHHLQNRVRVLDVAPNKNVRAGLVLSRKRIAPEHAKLMQVSVESMREDGTLLKILQRHIGADLAARSVP